MAEENNKQQVSRRHFIKVAGRALCGVALGGIMFRVAGGHLTGSPVGPNSRFVWQIDPQKCSFCGDCETSCVRRPSAVKAVNDQIKCSNCVICYGHIFDKRIDSDKVMSHGRRVCPHDAVTRVPYSGGDEGYFIYDIDHKKCTACAKCAKECNQFGTASMFLLIRPDLCLACNKCSIASRCPEGAIERLHFGSEDNFRGIYELEKPV